MDDDEDDLSNLWFSVDNYDEDNIDSAENQWWDPPNKLQPEPAMSAPQIQDHVGDVIVKKKRKPGNPWRRTPEYWELRLRLLREYHAQHGHIDVPYLYMVNNVTQSTSENKSSPTIQPQKPRFRLRRRRKRKDQFPLGTAVYALRTLYAQGQVEEKVPPDVIDELNRLGMTWSPIGQGRRPARFQKMLSLWKNATTASPSNDTMVQQQLSSWMWKQRYLFDRQENHGLAGPLTPDRVQALKEVGILPFERPKTKLQSYFDKQWRESLEQWKDARHKDLDNVWMWEQQRMYHTLLGKNKVEEASIQFLPNLLTGPRIHNLTESGAFLEDSILPHSLPPEHDVMTLDLDWAAVWPALEAFRHKHGHVRVTPQIAEDDSGTLYSICRWLLLEYKQIQADNDRDKRETVLNDERIQSLRNIGFFQDNTPTKKQQVDPLESEYQWWEYYHELRRYRDRYGTVNVSSKDDTDLHEWLQLQQGQFQNVMEGAAQKEGEIASPVLTETHYVALSNLGVVFPRPQATPGHPVFGTAESTFVGRPPAILELNGDVAVPDLRNVQGKTHKATVEELVWMSRYEEMKLFIDEHGHCRVPTGDTNSQQLALWAYNQRLQHKQYMRGQKTSSLTPRRIQLLREIRFEFDDTNDTFQPMPGSQRPKDIEHTEWKSMLKELVRYKREHGHCYIPAGLPNYYRLGQWVHTQRQLYQQRQKAGTSDEGNVADITTRLTKEQINLLQEAGLDLQMDNMEYSRQAFQTLWDARIAELTAFKLEKGHCRVQEVARRDGYAGGWSKYKQLARWVGDQQRLYKLWRNEGTPSQLNDKRIDQLNALGFEWEDSEQEG